MLVCKRIRKTRRWRGSVGECTIHERTEKEKGRGRCIYPMLDSFTEPPTQHFDTSLPSFFADVGLREEGGVGERKGEE